MSLQDKMLLNFNLINPHFFNEDSKDYLSITFFDSLSIIFTVGSASIISFLIIYTVKKPFNYIKCTNNGPTFLHVQSTIVITDEMVPRFVSIIS